MGHPQLSAVQMPPNIIAECAMNDGCGDVGKEAYFFARHFPRGRANSKVDTGGMPENFQVIITLHRAT
jgi:hypothetical protein